MSVKLVLQSNSEGLGHLRKEAILTDQGVAFATSQHLSIDLQFGRPLYDHQVVFLTEEEMDRVCEWWQSIKAKGVSYEMTGQ